MSQIKVQCYPWDMNGNPTTHTFVADGWTVREDRVLSVWRNIPPPENVPRARAARILAQFNQDQWFAVLQFDSPEVAE